MALGLGKKNNDTDSDWANAAGTPGSDPANNFGNNDVPAKKKPPVAILAGVIALLAVAGAGAYFFLLAPPVEDDVAPVGDPTQVATAPADPGDPSSAAPAADPAAKPVMPAPAKPAPKPAAKPAAAAKAPTPVAKPKPKPTPTPGARQGLTGQDGKGLEPGNTVLAVQAVSPALQAELRQLWQQGANAKWRGDYAGARRAWTKMLQLRPGHPGVQSAIDKLPK